MNHFSEIKSVHSLNNFKKIKTSKTSLGEILCVIVMSTVVVFRLDHPPVRSRDSADLHCRGPHPRVGGRARLYLRPGDGTRLAAGRVSLQWSYDWMIFILFGAYRNFLYNIFLFRIILSEFKCIALL